MHFQAFEFKKITEKVRKREREREMERDMVRSRESQEKQEIQRQ